MLVSVLALPLYYGPSDDQPDTVRPLSPDGLILGIPCILSAALMLVLAGLAQAGHRAVRHRGLRLPYEALTLIILILTVFLGAAIASDDLYEIRPGYVVCVLGSLIQIAGAIRLWRVRNRRRPLRD